MIPLRYSEIPKYSKNIISDCIDTKLYRVTNWEWRYYMDIDIDYNLILFIEVENSSSNKFYCKHKISLPKYSMGIEYNTSIIKIAINNILIKLNEDYKIYIPEKYKEGFIINYTNDILNFLWF
jgi:hypothetical protein